ncbi:ArsR/SmtB family transcription factor [Haloarcula argentinensis]|uniref:ArsR/SmtB family transcription factor n=1 Tax=Haloarcula argentinensis TaxID=43776 RepID=UPI0002B135F2|nr:metalloregulator ArsR/SmtB family transcription factor [Haloarcula argentinensis]EMA17986.1 ArsR family transcriptional regulator [Haloarcula argentinensis DSM 12282]
MSESSSDDGEIANLETLLSENAVETDVQTLSALGYETRYRLVRLLVEVDSGLDFCEITPHVDVSDSAVSHALTLLCDAGLIQKEKRGRSRHYRATKRAIALVAVLDGTR